MTPLTVLMAVHNGSRYLKTAMDSILNQTFRDFCFLIVDDASTDDTREIIRSYSDSRIRLLCLEKNVGQTAALNAGLKQVETPWIARMDADDFSARTRLEEQWRTLEADPALRCLGTFAWWFREDPFRPEGVIARPLDDQAIKRQLLRGTPMIHGTLMVSREALMAVGGYNERYRYSQDRDLFNRLLTRFTAANIPKPLLGFRRHAGQGSFCVQAAEESVEIFSSMIRDSRYTPAERGILRESLACSYLFRGSCFKAAGERDRWWNDLGRPWRLSPAATLRTLSGSVIPPHLRESLKAVLSGNGVKSQ